MTATITLPDSLNESSEQLARELGVSRDELLVTALQQYVDSKKRSFDADLKKRFDEVYSKADSRFDPLFETIQVRSLPQDDW